MSGEEGIMLHFSDYFYSSNHALNFPLLIRRLELSSPEELRLSQRNSFAAFSTLNLVFLLLLNSDYKLERESKSSIQVFLFFIFAIVSINRPILFQTRKEFFVYSQVDLPCNE